MTEFASAQGFPDAKTVLAKHRMPIALSVSLLVHALLLSLSLGGNGFGLPGLQLPWKERRLEADQLRILLTMTRSGASEPAALRKKRKNSESGVSTMVVSEFSPSAAS